MHSRALSYQLLVVINDLNIKVVISQMLCCVIFRATLLQGGGGGGETVPDGVIEVSVQHTGL